MITGSVATTGAYATRYTSRVEPSTGVDTGAHKCCYTGTGGSTRTSLLLFPKGCTPRGEDAHILYFDTASTTTRDAMERADTTSPGDCSRPMQATHSPKGARSVCGLRTGACGQVQGAGSYLRHPSGWSARRRLGPVRPQRAGLQPEAAGSGGTLSL